MRVLQLIDSLEAGGAERVAVNYANALTTLIDASFLCATRREGLLKESLSPHVGYAFLNKTHALDLKAILALKKFIKVNQIDIVHAHATSFFMGTLMKILNPSLTLIWHDHYGNTEYLKARPVLALKVCSKFFNGILCVNSKLESWARDTLYTQKVQFLPNFAVLSTDRSKTTLKGAIDKRMVCLANLRPQKGHLTLLEAFKTVVSKTQDWTLHLVGKDFNDAYSKDIKLYIKDHGLENRVFIYGSCSDAFHILNQATIGVLSSKSEGLPLALLEYGLTGLPVVATDVGDCNRVISNPDLGQLVPPENPRALSDALLHYIKQPKLRKAVGKQLQLMVETSFSETKMMQTLLEIYNQNYR